MGSQLSMSGRTPDTQESDDLAYGVKIRPKPSKGWSVDVWTPHGINISPFWNDTRTLRGARWKAWLIIRRHKRETKKRTIQLRKETVEYWVSV
jgi:hypothetical protein